MYYPTWSHHLKSETNPKLCEVVLEPGGSGSGSEQNNNLQWLQSPSSARPPANQPLECEERTEDVLNLCGRWPVAVRLSGGGFFCAVCSKPVSFRIHSAYSPPEGLVVRTQSFEFAQRQHLRNVSLRLECPYPERLNRNTNAA